MSGLPEIPDWQRALIERWAAGEQTMVSAARRAGKVQALAYAGAGLELACEPWDVLGDSDQARTIRRRAREVAAEIAGVLGL